MRAAAERGIPIVLCNQGESRGEAHARVRLDAPVGDVLPRIAAALPPVDATAVMP